MNTSTQTTSALWLAFTAAVLLGAGTAARSQAPPLVPIDTGELQGVVADGVAAATKVATAKAGLQGAPSDERHRGAESPTIRNATGTE